ncbi:MAG: response regulator [Elusimicrobia bacterium]|nr:response regulator [Elusimicrobiota bacterium]
MSPFHDLRLFHKLVLYGLASVVATGVLLSAAFYRSTREMVLAELELRGRMLGQEMVRDAKPGIETRNIFHTLEPVVGSAVLHPDIAYAQVLDVRGEVLAQAGAVPSSARPGRPSQPQGGVLKMSLPVSSAAELLDADDSGAGVSVRRVIGSVRLGVSTEPFRRRMRNALLLALSLLVALTLAGAAGAWAIGRRLSRPIRDLAEAAARIGAGEHGAEVAAASQDELGDLARTFNQMSRDLARATAETERSGTELAEALRFQAALNDMLRFSLAAGPLPQKLEHLLGLILTTPGFEVESKGCVFLRRGSVLEMTAQVGMPEAVRTACGRLTLGRCLCGRVGKTGEEVLSTHVNELHEVSYPGLAPHGHVCLPLRAESRIVGVLNLYLKAGRTLEQRQLEFARAAAGIIAGVVLLSESTESLLQLQKMEAVGLLAGGIAHDFNNVLATIVGYNYFMLEGLDPASPLRAYGLEVRRASELAASLTRQLLAVSRKQVVQPRVIDVNMVLTGLGRMLRRLLGANVDLVLEMQPSLWPVKMDCGQLEQVLLNLLVNARDAMPDGGKLVMATRQLTVGAGNAPDPHAPKQPGRYVQLEVRDTGVGMDEGTLSRVFEPFFTTKEPGRGTGLGLTTVMSIVAQYQGHIAVESRPGRGTCFRIYLPAAEGGVSALLPGAVPAEVKGGSETILVAEDNKALLGIIKKALRQKGYRVLAAESSADAVAQCSRLRTGVDLLLADLVLPGINGLDLAKRLGESYPRLKVIYMSGYAGSIGAKVEQLLYAVLLEKPFSPEQLLAAVRSTLDAVPAEAARSPS